MNRRKTIRLILQSAFPVLTVLMFSGCLPEYYLQRCKSSGIFLENQVSTEPANRAGGVTFGAPAAFALRQNISLASDSMLVTDSIKSGRNNVFFNSAPAAPGLSVSCAFPGIVVLHGDLLFGVIGRQLVYDLNMGIGVRLYNDHVSGHVMITLGLSKYLMDVHVIEHTPEGFFDYGGERVDVSPTVGIVAAAKFHPADIPVEPLLQIGARYRPLFKFKDLGAYELTIGLTAGLSRSFAQWRILGSIGANALTGFNYANRANITLMPTALVKVQYELEMMQ
jgi:hypothetical protein